MVLEIWHRFEAFGRSCNTALKKWRQPITSPVCSLLIRLHINQSHVSIFRFLLLLGFGFLWTNRQYIGSMIILAAYFFMDWIDGDLSRALKHDSDLGKFEDVTIDNLMVITFPFVLIWQKLIPGFLGALYIFLATQAWWFSVIRRNLAWKSDWLLRALAGSLLHILRYWVVTILIVLYAIWRLDWFTPVLWMLSIMMALHLAYDYYQIIKNRLHNRE